MKLLNKNPVSAKSKNPVFREVPVRMPHPIGLMCGQRSFTMWSALDPEMF